MKHAAIALAALVSTAAYLALAVWGFGGLTSFLADPARIALIAVFVGLAITGMFSSGNISPGEREDRANRWVLPVLIGIGFFSAWLAPYTDRHDIWTMDGEAMRWTGVALLLIGGVIRLWPVFVLGNRFSGLVAIQKGHRLVTTGIYAKLRNPSYLGLLLTGFAWAIAFRSLPGVILALPMIPVIIARIHAEEKLLAAQFGTEYEAYRRHSWRLIPGFY
jgi:protein-S-isoprenylcysteine O-methyltransferase Ste14